MLFCVPGKTAFFFVLLSTSEAQKRNISCSHFLLLMGRVILLFVLCWILLCDLAQSFNCTSWIDNVCFLNQVCLHFLTDLALLITALIPGLMSDTWETRFYQPYRRLEEVPEIPAGTTSVYLQGNVIRDIKPGAFSLLASCTRLDLRNNLLVAVRAEMWEGLTELRILSLEQNKIEEISPGAFSTLHSLEKLNLQENNITALERTMLTAIPSLGQVWGRGFSKNPISSIEAGTFAQLSNLHLLSLEHTGLTEIRSDMFEGLVHFDQLLLNHCKFTDIISGTFSTMPNLKYLELKGNKLSNLHSGMWEGIDLTALFLSNNEIQSIDGHMWEGLENLALLSMHGNPIRYISPQMWEGLTNLKTLELGSINISFIPPNTFENMPKLRHLLLYSNRLHTLSRNIFGVNHPEEVWVDLAANPLQCDSRLCWMMEAEEAGWFHATRSPAVGTRPVCANHPNTDWDQVDFECADGGNWSKTFLLGSSGQPWICQLLSKQWTFL